MAWRSLRQRNYASTTLKTSGLSAGLGGSITFMDPLGHGKVTSAIVNFTETKEGFMAQLVYLDALLYSIGGREKAPAAFCRKTLTSTDKFEMWGDGVQTRSFTFIDECVEGVLR